jgi:hypothetical protein
MKKKRLPYGLRSLYYLYFLLDGHEIVYIGFTGSLKARLKAHKALGKQFTSHKSIRLGYYNFESALLEKDIILGFEIEHKLIRAFQPKYNGDCITGRVSLSERLKEKRATRLKKAA